VFVHPWAENFVSEIGCRGRGVRISSAIAVLFIGKKL